MVAEAGGIVGVWTHLADSPEEFVASVTAMVDAIGIEHVGIGSDADLLSSRVGGATNHAWRGMSQGFFAVVVAEMRRQGFTTTTSASRRRPLLPGFRCSDKQRIRCRQCRAQGGSSAAGISIRILGSDSGWLC